MQISNTAKGKELSESIGKLMEKFSELSQTLKKTFTYVDARFELKKDDLFIMLRADNEPR